MKNRNHSFKFILSVFLMLAALFVAADRQTVAHAAGGDRIYYFNMDDNGLEGSMMLVESNGSWGLVDAGHTKAASVQDKNGVYYSTTVNGLSSQVYCRNGRDVANYMINQLGVRHLDFIVGTHAHSDHVGGIPEVAAATYKDASGRTCYLVDGSTTYYYKEYQHISNLEDDLVRYSSNSWHNQAFAYQAEQAMKNRGATLVDVSKSPMVVQGDPNNAYGDYITFNVGDMSFRLYNVHEQTNTGNENVNSIVTVMTNGNYTVVNLADINTGNGAIDKTSQAIAKDYGKVDVVVAGHHGYAGSNTKTMFDSLQPSFVVVPNGQESSWLYTDCDLAAAIPYAQGLFGTAFYNLSISQYAVVTDLSGRQVYVYTVNGKGNLESAINKMMKSANKTGWVSWIQTNGTLWSYLQNGQSVKDSWMKIGGKWYLFDPAGIMKTGVVSDSGKKYYLDSDGAMQTGWVLLGGKWYYFDPAEGHMLTGWQSIKGKEYFFNGDGTMKTGWFKSGRNTYYLYSDAGYAAQGWEVLNGKQYYFNPADCVMVTGWQSIDGKEYFFDSNGVMQTGWLQRGNAKYYLYSDTGAAFGWHRIDGKWYHFNEKQAWLDTPSGWQSINGKEYFFDSNGVMQTGWLQRGNTVYYLYGDTGYAAQGWEVLNGKQYYFNPADCVMVTGWQSIDGKEYFFDSNGIMQTGWLQRGDAKYYLYGDTGFAAQGWETLGGKTYYFNPADCVMQTDWQQIGGKWYYFSPNDGHMLQNTTVDGYYINSDGVWVS